MWSHEEVQWIVMCACADYGHWCCCRDAVISGVQNMGYASENIFIVQCRMRDRSFEGIVCVSGSIPVVKDTGSEYFAQ